jgi:hypothetical protein
MAVDWLDIEIITSLVKKHGNILHVTTWADICYTLLKGTTMKFVVCDHFYQCPESFNCGGAHLHQPQHCDPCTKYEGTPTCVPVTVEFNEPVPTFELKNLEALLYATNGSSDQLEKAQKEFEDIKKYALKFRSRINKHGIQKEGA